MRIIAALLALLVFPVFAADEPSARHALGASVTAVIQMPNKARVVSAIDAGSYTYIEVPDGDKTMWLAAMEVAVKKGDAISYSDGPVMTNFYSKSLNRNFAKVIFVNKVAVIK